MNDNQLVIISMVYDAGSSNYKAEFVAEHKVYLEIIQQWKDVANQFVEFKGRVNDINSNIVNYCIKRDAIICIDCMFVDGLT